MFKLKIEGSVGYALIPIFNAMFISKKLGIEQPISFIADSRYWSTMVSMTDALRMGLPVVTFEPSFEVANAKSLPDVTLRFISTSNDIVDENLDIIIICDFGLSRIGRDILSRFRFVYSKETVYLERP